ncbi:PRTRC system protein C [Dysgonomonas termitidis]|uniref:PRTRC system protein C n=1 Tax=Dysgonomonas termitidis TaxID=1516126 RepID=A0ABV9L2G9_9BACT
MALNITTVTRVFRIEKTDIELNDIDPEMSLEDVMGFYSAIYPQLTTASVQGPEFEDDKAVYTFKTTIGTKG